MVENAAPEEADVDVTEAPRRHRSHRFPARPHRLAPRLSGEELAQIEAAAAQVGMTPTGFCADAAVAAARGDRDVSGLAGLQRELFAARTAVNRVGTNLNQAVAALNATGEPPAWLMRVVLLCAQSVVRLDQVSAAVDRRLR